MEKRCCHCGQIKNIIFFCKNKRMKDKINRVCKQCQKEYRELNKNKR